MANVNSIYNAVEYIENNLTEEITIADVARSVFYSLYHFCRLFNRTIHHSPYDYLMRRRLSESARELIETDRRIIDIALDYQFNNPETYSRAFKRMFGQQPSQWKKRGGITRRFFKSRSSLRYILHLNKGDYLKPRMLEMRSLRLRGLMTLMGKERETASALWTILDDELRAFGDRIPRPCKYYGLVFYPDECREVGPLYLAAIESGSNSIPPSCLVAKTIPEFHCARFVHKGLLKDLDLTLEYIYQTWLPKSGKRLARGLEIEFHGQDERLADTEQTERDILIPVE